MSIHDVPETVGIKLNSSTEVNDQFSPLSSVTAEDNLQPLSEQQKEYFVNSITKECFSWFLEFSRLRKMPPANCLLLFVDSVV